MHGFKKLSGCALLGHTSWLYCHQQSLTANFLTHLKFEHMEPIILHLWQRSRSLYTIYLVLFASCPGPGTLYTVELATNLREVFTNYGEGPSFTFKTLLRHYAKQAVTKSK